MPTILGLMEAKLQMDRGQRAQGSEVLSFPLTPTLFLCLYSCHTTSHSSLPLPFPLAVEKCKQLNFN